ncbi:CRISPR-associated endonuclease Cas1 [Parenemella sanctibonifatiensis]|uniref:CRISPR-associated endonuclease Cas1 n=1 Tax=Parenemella sanctibonifatiensis TaxID=2016505 RepID=UPI001E30849E|nr:CRISPR-associated endonuclease Cas1 [Parenemella sanctibonifatiensis]
MTENAVIPISLVAHTVFCPRRAWLEAAGERVESVAIAAGQAAHARVDRPSQASDARAVEVSHEQLGIVGRCDVVRDQRMVIEYKSTPLRRKPEVTDPQRVQIALQVICLRDAGVPIDEAAVYFTNHKKHIPVGLTPPELRTAAEWVARTREVVESEQPPQPLLDDPRCRGCSHSNVCLPEEVRGTKPKRRIMPADPAGQMVHLTTPGARASIRSGRLVVVKGDDQLASIPMEQVMGVVVHGNIDLSSALIRELLWQGKPLTWASDRGRTIGFATPTRRANGLARVRQHVASHEGRIGIARAIVTGKVLNQATLLRRNVPDSTAPASIRRSAELIKMASSLNELAGLEGLSAAAYFREFPKLLRGAAAPDFVKAWPGRTGRTARDPLNAALNFVYGMLLADVTAAVVSCGLDPHAGFLHSPGRNKPALALDLMEEFRAPIADSVVMGAINNGELTVAMFSTTLGDARLREIGRNRLVAAYERRVATVIKHPVFGYSVTWRRTIEVQARLMLAAIDGTQPEYRPMRIR